MDPIPSALSADQAPQALGSIDLFNYSTLPKTGGDVDTSIWAQLSGDVSSAGDWVYDSVAGAWTNVKTGLTSVEQSISGGISDTISSLKTTMLMVIIGGLVIIWIVAKSGILTQLASFKP